LQPGKTFFEAVVAKILLAVSVATCSSGKLGALLINHENDAKKETILLSPSQKDFHMSTAAQAAKGNLLDPDNENNSQLKAANFFEKSFTDSTQKKKK